MNAVESNSEAKKKSDSEAPKPRRALPTILIVLATVIGIVSVFALWAERQLMEQDTWSETSQELVENGEIQSALADYIVTEIYANVDVEQNLADRLPPNLSPLAGTIATTLRQPAETVADKAQWLPSSSSATPWITSSPDQSLRTARTSAAASSAATAPLVSHAPSP